MGRLLHQVYAGKLFAVHNIAQVLPDLDAQEAVFYDAYRLRRRQQLAYCAAMRDKMEYTFNCTDLPAFYRAAAEYGIARAELAAIRSVRHDFESKLHDARVYRDEQRTQD